MGFKGEKKMLDDSMASGLDGWWKNQKSEYTYDLSQWHSPVIPALRKLREERPVFKASLGYINELKVCLHYTSRPCLKKTTKAKKRTYLGGK